MKYRAFAKDGASVSEVGLGCWQLGGDWGHVDDETALAILRASYDSGVTFFDTADVYGGGRSERIVGQFLKLIGGDAPFVATKVGRGEVYPDGYTEEAIRSRIEDSLNRLNVEVLDLVQTHCVPLEVMRSGEIYEWLGRLVEAGKILQFGASVESVAEADMLLENCSGLYSLQIIFNIFRQKPIDALFDKAQRKQIGIIARVPLASGVLSGKFEAKTIFGENDHRNYNKDGEMFNVGETFAGVPFEKAVELADRLGSMTPARTGLAKMALRWILDFDAVTTVIPGATRIEQARGNAGVSDLPSLNDSLHGDLKALYDSEIEALIRGIY
ncbi:MAG: aldo/keto reductase [Opitutales bacterium]|jgi:aryl-alcohol dehydrogenase-like predicted oxidoreductase|nr:aldo/keto reductase [Opitutales bacterium]MBT6768377.1 aldo/keto reductase [Opitutales bacterium]MBT7865164.1 aldo/keto reductase [Opitutales bacterium]